jgi:hypothetical protein
VQLALVSVTESALKKSALKMRTSVANENENPHLKSALLSPSALLGNWGNIKSPQRGYQGSDSVFYSLI